MRAAPPIHVSLRRFGVWRAGVAALGTAAGAALVAWLRARSFDPPASLAVAVALGVILLFVLRPLLAIGPVELRWDGRAWQLGPRLDRMTPGDLSVAIDLGGWLLLRFVEAWPSAPRRRPRVHWVPVQRRGLEAKWHALRCAVHAPRPAETAPAAGDRGP